MQTICSYSWNYYGKDVQTVATLANEKGVDVIHIYVDLILIAIYLLHNLSVCELPILQIPSQYLAICDQASKMDQISTNYI